MYRTPIFASTLLLILASAVGVFAQEPPGGADLNDPTARPQSELTQTRPTVIWPPQTGPSSWILYEQAPGSCCCGPIGGHGPIRMELYADAGVSLPVGGDLIAHSLSTGWMFEVGGRSLFFNRAETAAWNIDLGLDFIWNHGAHNNLQTIFPARSVTDIFGNSTTVFEPVSVANLYRTYINIGAGREWFLLGPTFTGNKNWIVGVDGGFQYGVASLRLNDPANPFGQFTRTTDQIFGGYVGLHTDLEIPCNCCTYLFGLRAEWDGQNLRSGLLSNPLNDQKIYDVNFLLTFGVRF
jgi:hypothetical protein